tara:strand:- start:23 stop:169 length:147 start_codon:yes stop_codon:yes gene_type:complete
MNKKPSVLDLNQILVKLPDNTINDIIMYTHNTLKPEIKNEINIFKIIF